MEPIENKQLCESFKRWTTISNEPSKNLENNVTVMLN